MRFSFSFDCDMASLRSRSVLGGGWSPPDSMGIRTGATKLYTGVRLGEPTAASPKCVDGSKECWFDIVGPFLYIRVSQGTSRGQIFPSMCPNPGLLSMRPLPFKGRPVSRNQMPYSSTWAVGHPIWTPGLSCESEAKKDHRAEAEDVFVQELGDSPAWNVGK